MSFKIMALQVETQPHFERRTALTTGFIAMQQTNHDAFQSPHRADDVLNWSQLSESISAPSQPSTAPLRMVN